MTTTAHLVDRYTNSRREVVLHDDVGFGLEARIAISMIEKWGMVVAKPDGEDSAGRAKTCVLPPHDLVEKACETASLAMVEFERRGWLVAVPNPFSVTEEKA